MSSTSRISVELVEGPARQQLRPQRRGNAAAAGGRSDGVADLTLPRDEVEMHDRGEAEEAVACDVARDEAGGAASRASRGRSARSSR